jgi:tetratricopeptide (TPR) repeat protein
MADNGRGRAPRAGDGRPGRSSGAPSGGRGGDRTTRGNDRTARGSAAGSAGGKTSRGERSGRPAAGAGRDDRKAPRRDDSRGGSRDRRAQDPASRSSDQAKYDGPPIAEDITGQELDHNVLQQLAGLPEKLANRVARHLVAAGRLLDEDPETAYQHTLAARARAARVAIVREATGEAAYAAGHFAEALSELRAAKRMNGASIYLAVMADCERALGRPEKALALAKNPSLAKLPVEQQIEMTLVEAGSRFDLGEVDGALRTLENAPLRSVTREDWLVRLRYAYADMLLKAGRREEAIEWFHRTAGIDGHGVTDAADRILELEGVVLRDSEDEPEA